MIQTDKWVYIHVPRTGGTTVETLFRKLWRKNPVLDAQHSTVWDLQKDYRNRFIFGFVRNPYTYEWSIWNSHRHWKIFDKFNDWCAFRFDGKEKEIYEKFPNQEYELDYCQNLFKHDMSGYFCDSEKKANVSQIYRFEELNESWKDIERRVNTSIKLKVYPRYYENKYKDDYTDYSYDLVSTHRGKDIALFGYNFDGYEGEIPLQFETDFVGYNYAYTCY